MSEAGFTGYDGGNTLILTGLKPETEYTVTCYVRTKEGSNESASQTFVTPALELITLQPRVEQLCHRGRHDQHRRGRDQRGFPMEKI